MKPTTRTARRIHQALVSRIVLGFATALLSVTLITVSRGQQPSPPPPQNPNTPPPSQNPQPNPQPPAPNPNPPTAAPGQPPASAQPGAPAVPFAQPATQTPAAASTPLTLNDAVQQAINQASTFQQARVEELIAAEDVRQARLAFLPRLTSPLSFIYNSPAHGANV